MDTAKYCIYHKQDVELYYVQMIKCRTTVDLNINTLNHNLSLIKQHPFLEDCHHSTNNDSSAVRGGT